MKIQTRILIGLILIIILISGCIQKTESNPKTDINNTPVDTVIIPTLTPLVNNIGSDKRLPQEEFDRRTIAQSSLDWAILGKNIPDYHLINDTNHIIVSTRNIDKTYNFSLENITFNILTPEEIQQKSNTEGDFLYFEFEMLNISGSDATVKLNNIWAESEENKKKGVLYLSGGGATIPFKKERGRWLRKSITETWIS